MAIESISGNSVTVSQTKPGAKEAADVKQKTPGTVSTDKVDFTDVANGLKAGVANAMAAPVTDEDRVSAIKLALQSGTYNVDVDKTAEKMLKFEKQLPNSV